MVDMQELIARLEAAEAGSRELDAMVWCALCPGGATYDRDTHRVSYPDKAYALISEFQAVTTSLDAALALAERVLPGWSWELYTAYEIKGVMKYGCNLGEEDTAYAPSPALALCIAILEAKAQGEGG